MSRLGDSLRELPVPDTKAAEDRTIRALTAAPVVEGKTFRSRLRQPSRAVVAAVALLAIAVVGLSPPGRDLAAEAAEAIGLTEPGDPATAPERPDILSPAGEQLVIGSGFTPHDEFYELVAYTTRADVAGGSDGNDRETCLALDFPGTESTGSAGCGGFSSPGRLDVAWGTLPGGTGSDIKTLPYLGVAPKGTARVQISTVVDGATRERRQARVFDLTSELQERIGARAPVAVFVSFLRSGLTSDELSSGTASIRVVALGADGEILAERTVAPGRLARPGEAG